MRTKHRQPLVPIPGPVSPFLRKTPAEIFSFYVARDCPPGASIGIITQNSPKVYHGNTRILCRLSRNFYEMKIKTVAITCRI